jgi:hypothetical protein
MKAFLIAGLFCWSAILNAGAQGLTAKATAAGPSSEAEIKVLRQELSALEGRVHELEKKADDAKNDGDDAAKEKKLDQRLDAIESAQRKFESDEEKTQQQGASHAKAPFVVYDKDDHPIFRIDVNANNSAQLLVGNALGAHAVIVANDRDKVAGIELLDGLSPPNKPQIELRANNKSRIYVASPDGTMFAMMGVRPDNSHGVSILTNTGNSLAFFGGKAVGKGYLELDDADGSIMVEAGMLNSHVGYVLTNPWQPSSTPEGDPSLIKGGRKKH